MKRETLSRRDLLTGKVGAEATGPEIHLSSLVVHVRPEHVAEVGRALAAMAGVEIHGQSDAGKIVITLETATEHDVVQRLGSIGELPGVLSAALVYHHFEPSS